eukprot:4492263-Amphidinium_carterae.1
MEITLPSNFPMQSRVRGTLHALHCARIPIGSFQLHADAQARDLPASPQSCSTRGPGTPYA